MAVETLMIHPLKVVKKKPPKQLYIMNLLSALTGLHTTYLMAGKLTDRPLY